MPKLEVSNLNYSCFFNYCNEHNINPDFLISGTNLSIDYIKNIHKRTSWIECNRILENFSNAIPSSKYEDVFRYAAIGKEYNRVAPILLGYLPSKMPYWIISKFLGKKLFTNVDFKFKEISENEISMLITISQNNSEVVNDIFFDGYIIVFKYLSLLINRSTAVVQIANRSNNSAEYFIKLPKRLSFFKRSIEFLKIFSGIRSSIFLVKDLNEENSKLEQLTSELSISNEIKNKLLIEVEQKNNELNQLYALKTTLLRMFVHDIATPVMIAKTNINFLKKIELERDTESINIKKYNAVNSALDNIYILIQDAKNLEDLNSFNKTSTLEPVNIDKAIHYAIGIVQEKLTKKNLRISYKSSLEKNTCFSADFYKFSNSVIANILSNSIKFSTNESVISISTYLDLLDFIVIKIEDHGIGMPSVILDDIFKMDKKTSRIGTNGELGTGYGMPIVKSMIGLLGGEIEIESHDIVNCPTGHGTIVTLKLLPLNFHVNKTISTPQDSKNHINLSSLS